MSEDSKTSEKYDSILFSVKKLIGISEEDESFDMDIMLNINAALSVLFQLGVVTMPFTITSKDNTYKDILPKASEDVINQVKMYLVYKTKLGFDSSTLSSYVIEVIKESIKEIECRLMMSFNPSNTFEQKDN